MVKEAGSVAQLHPLGAERTHANGCTSLSLVLLCSIAIAAAPTSQCWKGDKMSSLVSLVAAQKVLTCSLARSTQSVNTSHYYPMVRSFDQNTLGDRLGRNIPSFPFYR